MKKIMKKKYAKNNKVNNKTNIFIMFFFKSNKFKKILTKTNLKLKLLFNKCYLRTVSILKHQRNQQFKSNIKMTNKQKAVSKNLLVMSKKL